MAAAGESGGSVAYQRNGGSWQRRQRRHQRISVKPEMWRQLADHLSAAYGVMALWHNRKRKAAWRAAYHGSSGISLWRSGAQNGVRLRRRQLIWRSSGGAMAAKAAAWRK